MLARRDISSPSEAEAFLAAGESHDPFAFEGMDRVVETVLEQVRAGARITVYGDFDCDGVCATAILVGAIRRLGGNCDWLIPDRISDGYGLSAELIRSVADRGTALVITVDCGVTAVQEAALARELGMEIVITDHHAPGPELPDCPILHPVASGYPYEHLCGAAVAAKLAAALRRSASPAAGSATADGSGPGPDEADLDLVALATVADVMPLTGENRHLVREGLRVARRARRVGLAALMAETRLEPSRIGTEDLGFRLGPRINAAGRLYRADAGVELFLAESRERADEIARELGGVNAERRRIESEVERLARAEIGPVEETGPAVVVAGADWHPGVVGIVASKLVKATGRPSVVISLDGEAGRGSARSVPGLDLHAALSETSHLLESFGGHAAAAGLSIRADQIDRFRQELGRAVAERVGSEPVEPLIDVDALAGGPHLGMDLASELQRLEPFGNANPPVRLLVPGARIEELTEMGEGRHCRFTVRSGSHRARGVCFGRTSFGLTEGERADVIAELGLNHWNGSVEPQLRVLEVCRYPEATDLPACDPDEWWERFETAMAGTRPGPTGRGAEPLGITAGPDGLPGVAVAELISSGERLVIVTADARNRWRGLGGEALGRFIPEPAAGSAGGEHDPRVAGIWAGSPRAEITAALGAQVLLTDFASLTALEAAGGEPRPFSGFDRIALLDPPYSAPAVEPVRASGLPVHLLAGPDEIEFSRRVGTHRLDLTGQLRGLYRALRDAGRADGQTRAEALRKALAADGSTERSPEEAAVLLRVLVEAGLARSEGLGGARVAGVVSSERTDLAASAVFVEHFRLHEEQNRFLSQFNRQTSRP